MPVAAVDNSADTSSEMKKRIAEQTKALLDTVESPTSFAQDAAEVTSETEETEETEQTEEASAEETETSEEETAEKPAETPTKKETLHKLKVEGKEEELPYEKVIEYAQKGRFLEREQQRIKEEKRRLEEEKAKLTQPTQPTFDVSKFNESLIENLNKDPGGTLLQINRMTYEMMKQQETDERKAERAFEKARKDDDPDTWEALKPLYEDFRDQGVQREQAYLMAENELLRRTISVVRNKGIKEGTEKIKAKQRAEIPTAQTKTKVKTKTLSPEEFRKLPASEMKKRLPRAAPREDW